MNESWMSVASLTLAQAEQPALSAAPAGAPAAAPVNAVGVPGSSPATVSGSGAVPPPGGGSSSGGGLGLMVLLPVMLVAMVLMTTLSGRKEKKRRAALMAAVKKHDRVSMMGGIVGTVAELTDDEIVLRVEEGRIRFARSALQAVLTSGPAPAGGGRKQDALVEAKSDASRAGV